MSAHPKARRASMLLAMTSQPCEKEGGREGGREGGKTYFATEHAGDVALEEIEGVVDGLFSYHRPQPILPMP